MGSARTLGLTTADRPWEWEDVRATPSDRGISLVHIHEGAELHVRDGRLVRGPGYQRASRQARRSLARVGAILRLRARGRYLMHASAAVDLTGGAWLLAGDSGSGKSTLAWVLVRNGWTLLGDDGVVIEDADQGFVARAWRDPLRVSLDLSSRFPELASLAPKRATGDARARVPVERDITREAPLRAILFLQRDVTDRITRVGPAVTLASLVRQSPWVLIDDADAPRHLDLLAAVASAVPAYHVAHTAAQLDQFPQTVATIS